MEEKIKSILSAYPNKLILSNLTDKSYKYKKTTIVKKIIKEKISYQIERFTDKQAFHENIEADMLETVVLSEFPANYKQINIFTEDAQYDFKASKKERFCLINNHPDLK